MRNRVMAVFLLLAMLVGANAAAAATRICFIDVGEGNRSAKAMRADVTTAAADAAIEIETRYVANVAEGRDRDGTIERLAKTGCVMVVVGDSPDNVAAMLFVDAPDGPQPKTRLSIIVAAAAGVRDLSVYLRSADQLGDPELLQLVESETRELLNSHGFPGDDVSIVHCTSMCF